MERIPLARPDLRGNEEANVIEAVRSTWISSTGRFVDEFEERFSQLTGAASTVSVSNGTAALHVAMMALDVRPGDEVLVPSLTYVATANAVRYVGAEPVFVDVDPDTWTLDPSRIEDAVTHKTRGIIPVHLYGHPADMDAINRLAAVHGLWVLEDAAEAHGALYRGRPVGSLARAATFSFYGNKIVTSGEGGAICTSDPQLEVRLRTLRGQGVDPQRRYFFPVTGYNFRLTNVACGILCAQLDRFDELQDRRREIYQRYEVGLGDVPGIELQPTAPWATTAPWLFSITISADAAGCSRDDVARHLEQDGIETRPFFIPLHTLPPFRREAALRGDTLPVTERLAHAGLNLPTFTEMTDEQVDRVVARVRAAVAWG